jgi:hypothetical protein
VLLHGVSQSVHQGFESLCDVCSMFANFDPPPVRWYRYLVLYPVQYSTYNTRTRYAYSFNAMATTPLVCALITVLYCTVPGTVTGTVPGTVVRHRAIDTGDDFR